MQINRQILKNLKASATTGRAILVIAALVSGIATGKMMYLGSLDDHWLIRAGKVALGLGLVEGAIAWTYHGIRKVFTNGKQQFVAWLFLFALLAAVLTNLFTERMLSRGLELNDFQQAWVDWAFDVIVVGVMIAIGAIQLFSDDARIERLALKQIGEETEAKIEQMQASFPDEISVRETGPLDPGKGLRR